jgi:hypothetical protein
MIVLVLVVAASCLVVVLWIGLSEIVRDVVDWWSR